MCGVHHKPVDQHASIYTVMDLEQWKRDQVSGAVTGGTRLTDSEAAALVRLTSAQLTSVDQITRLAYRLERVAERAQTHLTSIERSRLREREQLSRSSGLWITAIDDDGTETPIDPSTITLGRPGEARFDTQRNNVIESRRVELVDLVGQLGEEMAVLRARDSGLGTSANRVVLAAQLVVDTFHASEVLDLSTKSMHVAVAQLNQIAVART